MRGALLNSGRHLLATILSACLLFLAASPASARNTPLHPCIGSAQAGEDVVQVLNGTVKFDCNAEQNALTPGDYWIKFAVPKSAQPEGKGLIFRTASLWDEGFQIWAVHENGRIAQYDPFGQQALSPMRLGATIIVPIRTRGEAPVYMLVAKVENSAAVRGVMLQSQLSTNESAITFEMAMAVLYAGFAGLCIALLVYNIALWRGMRERFLLAYCAMLATTLTYGFFTSGAPHYFLPGLSGAGRLAITTPLLAFTASSALIFMRYFFENANIPKWLVRLTWAQCGFMAAFSLLYSAIAPSYVKLLDLIYVYGFIPVPLLFATYVFVAWQKKDPFLGYFLLAWSGPAISAVFRMLHGLDILPYHILIENSTLLGLALEALVSSLAIGHRVRLLAQARDRAELAEAHAMAIADTDPLTGLLNRRSFLRKVLERDSSWTLLLLDIDHFKRVNDTLGHAGGDDAITCIADLMRGSAPAGALVARMGGEEFAICYRSDIPGLIDPDRLLANVRAIDLPGGYRITASVGIASRRITSEADWNILYRAADMALYRAKTSGRDCHMQYNPGRVAA